MVPTEHDDDAPPTSNGDATLTTGSGWAHVVKHSGPLETLAFAQRYEPERELGRGGMGAVMLCEDRQIGRRVAMKSVRTEHAGAPNVVGRFVREARVQAQLEHPAVVPVYELGLDPAGGVYFTMKRVRGVTLGEVIRGLRERDTGMVERFSRRRLLTAFSAVCLAIDFAHERGIVHRDLKPSNIMLGDYGEVYVLDWGIAQARDAAQESRGTTGTPGYMAPEQLVGTKKASTGSDVYALGAILYELLTREKLNVGAGSVELKRSALAGEQPSTLERAPELDIAPELDVICRRATAREVEHRYRSPRELSEAIEYFLDGERDDELRRTMAARHADAAREAGKRALAGSLEERREALREVGRALALDPQNQDAVGTMVELLTIPPPTVPPDVTERLEADDAQQRRTVARLAAVAYLSLFLYWPLMQWTGVRQPWLVALFYALVLATAGSCAAVGFSRRPTEGGVLRTLALSMVTMGMTAIFFGPLIVVPGVVAVNTAAYALTVGARGRRLVVALGMLAIAVPIALEFLGVVAPSYAFSDAGMTVLPTAIHLTDRPALIFLVLASVATVLTGTASVGGVRDALRQAEQRLQLYSWHFRQLVPQGYAPQEPSE